MSQPKKKFKAGEFEATVWENQKDGQKWDSFAVQRNYPKDKNNLQGEWEHETIHLRNAVAIRKLIKVLEKLEDESLSLDELTPSSSPAPPSPSSGGSY